MSIQTIRFNSGEVMQILGLTSSLVGVKLIWHTLPMPLGAKALSGHRYCQALMKASHGEKVTLDSEGIACPAAAAAFGFKLLPEGLKSGKGLMGFGITKKEITGKTMFEGMTTLPQDELRGIYLFPLEQADIEPDVVVVEDEIERLMWIALAQLNAQAGKRVTSSTAILQATCVYATIIPYIEQKLNISFGCYGCRDATDIGNNETVLGFPFKDFQMIYDNILHLNLKAIPNSRGKNAYTILRKKDAEKITSTDPF
jgi:uncharacterized protein (DUF169 family)